MSYTYAVRNNSAEVGQIPMQALKPLRVLVVEDSSDDLSLLLIALRRGGYAPDYTHVQTSDELGQALRTRLWDIVLSDYTLPDFSGLLALHQVRDYDPDMPFIIISGNIGEDVAVAAMKAGAHDYLIKGNLTRLGAAIERELREAAIRRARRRDELELRQAKQRLQALSNRMLEVQEAERRHIARELHDEIGQSLTAIKLNLEALQRRVGDDATRRLVGEITGVAGQVLDQVRQISLDLRPPQLDDLGLAAALHWLVKRHAHRERPAIHLSAPENLPRLDPQVETACFRIVQEALTNVLRHAEAAEVRIELGFDPGHFRVAVRDNGCGFDTGRAHTRGLEGRCLGLLGMDERVTLSGGNLEIHSRPGQGTEVAAIFPMAKIIAAEQQ